MIRVEILADSAVHRAGISSVLRADPDVRIVAASRAIGVSTPFDDESLAAPSLASTSEADVTIVVGTRRAGTLSDMLTSDGSDLDERGRWHATMVLLERMDARDAQDAYAVGASAVLAIDASAEELRAALRAVAAGLVVMPSGISTEMFAPARRVAASDSSAASTSVATLTSREREVLALLAQGLANKVIAARLRITEHTVKTHIAAVYEKLGARNRAEVLVAAARQGLVIL